MTPELKAIIDAAKAVILMHDSDALQAIEPGQSATINDLRSSILAFDEKPIEVSISHRPPTRTVINSSGQYELPSERTP